MGGNVTNCDRCGNATQVTIMSKFNRDTLCTPCKQDEQLAPGYQRASQVEHAACKRGDFNFQGVGLSAADAAFLAQRRAERVKAA